MPTLIKSVEFAITPVKLVSAVVRHSPSIPASPTQQTTVISARSSLRLDGRYDADEDQRKFTQYLSVPLGRGGSDPIDIRLGAFSGICRPAPGLGRVFP